MPKVNSLASKVNLKLDFQVGDSGSLELLVMSFVSLNKINVPEYLSSPLKLHRVLKQKHFQVLTVPPGCKIWKLFEIQKFRTCYQDA